MRRQEAEKIVEAIGYDGCPANASQDICESSDPWAFESGCRECWIDAIMKAVEKTPASREAPDKGAEGIEKDKSRYGDGVTVSPMFDENNNQIW